ncbi:MAG: hypothetical protein K0S09_1773 [Sphingobacteriaceae bacterium]|jgi:hypothetical protein|nr:hypothetical protein [Sphingobacteriaceae bacterium]
MIQRIQTIWLVLASLALFCLFLFPYLQVMKPDGSAQAIKVTGVYEVMNNEPVKTQEFTGFTILTVIVALLPLVIIFFYKERKKQIALCYLVIVSIIGYGFWLAQTAKGIIGNIQLDIQNYGIGVLLPSIAIIFIILALKAIRHDEKLIKSADRLR